MAKKQAGTGNWRDRIIEVKQMRVGDILPHPLQHKTHPEKQNRMLRGNLETAGKVDVLRAYTSERAGGKLTFFDGHGRRSLNPDEIWHVAICDLSDAEADLELAVFDEIGKFAQIEKEALDALLREVGTGDAALQELLSELAQANDLVPPDFDQNLLDRAGDGGGEGGDGESGEDLIDAEPQIDKAAELNKKWKVKTGDLFQIGRKVYCKNCHKYHNLKG